jgi:hypothetical protein
LTAQLDAELASILAVQPDLAVVALADGAEENWRYFDRPVYEHATKIVDYGHASQHLHAAMAAYYGEKTIEGRAEYLNVARKTYSIPCDPHHIRLPRLHVPARACRSSAL